MRRALLACLVFLEGFGAVALAQKDSPAIPEPVSAVRAREGADVTQHPLYLFLKRKRDEEWYRRVYFGYSFDLIQLDGNTLMPIGIGTGNIIPAVSLQTEFWPLRNWGVRFRWTKGLISYFPKVDPQNRSFKTIDLLSPDILFRWYLQSSAQSSYLQFGIGFHMFDFDLITDPDIPFVMGNRGVVFSIERKLAFNRTTGVRGNFDVIPLTLVLAQQQEMFDRNGGIGFHFGVEFYHTFLDEEGVETLVSLIYSQHDYLYNVTDTFRTNEAKAEYQQHFRSLKVQFSARF